MPGVCSHWAMKKKLESVMKFSSGTEQEEAVGKKKKMIERA